MNLKKHIKIRKQGKFYTAYEDDAYVLHAVFNYKVSNGRAGFPINVLGKVTNTLDEYKIDYVVIENDKEVIKKQFPINSYNKYLKKGKEHNARIKDEEELIEKIKNLSEEKTLKIIKYIEEVICE